MLFDPFGEIASKNLSVYKLDCVVPTCNNNRLVTPNKSFLFVPFEPEIRRKWLLYLKVDLFPYVYKEVLNSRINIFSCEDHFSEFQISPEPQYQHVKNTNILLPLETESAQSQSIKKAQYTNMTENIIIKEHDYMIKPEEQDWCIQNPDLTKVEASNAIKQEDDPSEYTESVLCEYCLKAFADKYALEKHTQECHIDIKPELFQCNKCSSSFINETEILDHLFTVHNNMQPDSLFNNCEFKKRVYEKFCLNEKFSVSSLQSNQSDFKPILYDCEICPLTFLNLHEMKDHRRLKHKIQPSSELNFQEFKYKNQIMTKNAKIQVTNYEPARFSISKVTNVEPARFSNSKVTNVEPARFSNSKVTKDEPARFAISKVTDDESARSLISKVTVINDELATKRPYVISKVDHKAGKDYYDYFKTDKIQKHASCFSGQSDSVTNGEVEIFNCTQCSISFTNKQELSHHIESHHIFVDLSPKEGVNNYISIYENFVKKEIEQQKEDRRNEIKTVTDPNKYATDSVRIITTGHSVKKESIIEENNRRTVDEKDSGTTASMGSLDTFRCYFCSLDHSNRYQLLKHIQEEHVHITPHSLRCKGCYIYFGNEVDLLEHVPYCAAKEQTNSSSLNKQADKHKQSIKIIPKKTHQSKIFLKKATIQIHNLKTNSSKKQIKTKCKNKNIKNKIGTESSTSSSLMPFIETEQASTSMANQRHGRRPIKRPTRYLL